MARARQSLAAILCVAFIVTPTFAEDWRQWLGPKRNGSTSETVTWTEASPLKEVWRAEVGNGFATPIIANGRVYMHARGKDASKEEEEVTAFDAVTGKVIW